MTGLAPAPARVGVASAAGRIWRVNRLHAVNPWPSLILPWLITGVIFGLTYAIWRLVASVAGGLENIDDNAFQYGGGASWILFYMMVVAVQAMNQTFRFALGFSVTRRDYYLGTALHFALVSVMYAAGFTALAAVEQATSGWGIDGAFFAPGFFADLPFAQVAYVYLMLFLLFSSLGAAMATVYVRWKSAGMLVVFGVLGAGIVAALWLITVAHGWAPVGRFFTTNSIPVIASWSLVVSGLSCTVGYGLLRRATPGE